MKSPRTSMECAKPNRHKIDQSLERDRVVCSQCTYNLINKVSTYALNYWPRMAMSFSVSPF